MRERGFLRFQSCRSRSASQRVCHCEPKRAIEVQPMICPLTQGSLLHMGVRVKWPSTPTERGLQHPGAPLILHAQHHAGVTISAFENTTTSEMGDPSYLRAFGPTNTPSQNRPIRFNFEYRHAHLASPNFRKISAFEKVSRRSARSGLLCSHLPPTITRTRTSISTPPLTKNKAPSTGPASVKILQSAPQAIADCPGIDGKDVAGKPAGARRSCVACRPPQSLDRFESAFGPLNSIDRVPNKELQDGFYVDSPSALYCY